MHDWLLNNVFSDISFVTTIPLLVEVWLARVEPRSQYFPPQLLSVMGRTGNE